MSATADVLVLNKGFMAVQICDWQKVLSLVWQGHAEVVDNNYQTYSFDEWAEMSKLMVDHPNGYVHTVNLKIAIPDVVRLTRYERLPSADVKFTRSNVYEHYKNKCSYCGERFPTSELNLDHVMPRSRGGKTNWENIVLTCIPCNSHKADRTPAEAGMKLLVKPERPKWKGAQHSLFSVPIKVRDSWAHFVDKCYWEGELDQS